MNIDMEFQGLDELIKTCENMSTETDLETINKKILEECSDLAYKKASSLIHKSIDNTKSGRRGARPPGHAADNIPKPKIRKRKDQLQSVIGWEKSDNSPYFYMKMEEWGTSERPPHHAFGLVNKMLFKRYEEIALKRYEKKVKELEK